MFRVNDVALFVHKMNQAIKDIDLGGKRMSKGENTRDTLLRELMLERNNIVEVEELLKMVPRLQVNGVTLMGILTKYNNIYNDLDIRPKFITGQLKLSSANEQAMDNRRTHYGWEVVAHRKLNVILQRIQRGDRLSKDAIRTILELQMDAVEQGISRDI